MTKEREMYGIKILSNDEYNEYKGTYEEQIEELQDRIQKAIEYLEYQLTQLDFYEDTKARVLCSMLIVILKGGK
jgi:hypothetical protein